MDIPSLEEMMKEELSSDLQPYVTEGPLGPSLKHPLVFQVVGIIPGLANRQLIQKEKEMAQAIIDMDYEKILWLYERPYRMSMVMEFEKILQDKSIIKKLLTQAWIDTEMPYQFGIGNLLRLFRKYRLVTDIEDALVKEELLASLANTTIYRGVTKAAYAKGISWTKSPKVANFFANRYAAKNGIVYACEIDPKFILGIFQGRGEDEVVIDVKKVKNFRIVK